MQNEKGTDLAFDKNQYLILNNPPQDELGLDLFGICEVLYKKRWFIMSVTAVCTCLAMAFSFTISPVYQVKTFLSEPKQDQLQALYFNTDSTLTGAHLFAQFLKTLSNKSNYIEFLKASGYLDASLKDLKNPTEKDKLRILNGSVHNYKVAIVNHFKNDYKDVYKDNSHEAELITLTSKFDATAKDSIAYVEYTNKKVLDEIAKGEQSLANRKVATLTKWIGLKEQELVAKRKNNVKRLLDEQDLAIAEINNKITALKQKDIRDRQTQLQALNNALIVAEKLGITHYNAPQEVKNHGLVIDVNADKKELYLRGTTYLKKAIELTQTQKHSLDYENKLSELKEQLYIAENNKKILALEKRRSDKPYIKNIEKNQIEMMRLKALNFDLSHIKTYNMMGSPIVDTSPLKPKKKVITLFGLVFGFMLASLLVLLQNSLQNRHSIKSENTD